jgi:hypothetical protein
MTRLEIYNELQLIQEFEANFISTNESESRRKELLNMLDTLNV